jgi:hypothetical protein
MTAYDKGRLAAKKGLSRKDNPYDRPDHQWRDCLTQERLATEWDEGFSNYDPAEEKERRSEGAKKAAQTRKKIAEIKRQVK